MKIIISRKAVTLFRGTNSNFLEDVSLLEVAHFSVNSCARRYLATCRPNALAPASWAKPPSSAGPVMKKIRWRRFKVPTWQFCNLASFQTSLLRSCYRNDQTSHLGIWEATSKRMKWNSFSIVFINLKRNDVVLRPVCEARSKEWRSIQA